jgi:hypothetical protein
MGEAIHGFTTATAFRLKPEATLSMFSSFSRKPRYRCFPASAGSHAIDVFRLRPEATLSMFSGFGHPHDSCGFRLQPEDLIE